MLNLLSFLRPSPRIRVDRLREAVSQTIHRAPKLRLVAMGLQRIGGETRRADIALTELRALRAGLTEHPGCEAGAELQSRGNIALAATFGVADLGVQAVVCQANFGQYGWPVVAIATLFITAAFTATGLGLVHSLANDARPEQSIRRGKYLSLTMTALVIGSALMVAYLRFAGAETSDAMFDHAATAWWVLAEMLPVAAGAWLAVAYQRNYPRLVEGEIRKHEEYLSDLKALESWLEDVRRRFDVDSGTPSTEPTAAPTPVRPPQPAAAATPESLPLADSGVGLSIAGSPRIDSGRNGVDAAAIGTAAAALVVALMLPAVSHAQGRAPARYVAASTAARPCGLAVDRSPNGVPASRLAAIEAAIARLDEWLSTQECGSLVTAAFADAGAYTPRTALVVPQLLPAKDCVVAADTSKVDPKHAPLMLFSGYGEKVQRQARTRCEEAEARARNEYAGAMSRFLREVRASAAQEQVPPPLAANISGLLQSYFAAGITELLVVSTGIDGAGIPERLPSGAHVVFVAFEAKDGFLGRAATDAAAEKWKRAGATVLAFPQLTPGTLTRVLRSGPHA